MKNKLKLFIEKWNNRFLESYDPTNKYQCYDVIIEWAKTLGLPVPLTLYAYQIYDAFPDGWTRKQNMSNSKPEAGDIVVWAKGYAGGVAGHTAVATGAGVAEGKSSDWFEVFSQNDPLGTPCQVKRYNFNYVRGWIRPNIELEELEVLDTTMTDFERKKLVQFDRTCIELYKAGFAPDATSEYWFENAEDEDKFTNLIKKLIAESKEVGGNTARIVELTTLLAESKVNCDKQKKDLIAKIMELLKTL